MTQFLRFFLLITILASSLKGEAARSSTSGSDYSAFVGIGGSLGTPNVYRLGINNWEFGLITDDAIGINKVLRRDSTYATFGLVYSPVESASAGFMGGVGWEPELWWGFTFRGEMTGEALYSGKVHGVLIVGLGYHL